MYTIGKLAKAFNISRSALLYYEKIGLLASSNRSEKGYRLYSEKDFDRLRKILSHRAAGIPLESIYALLESKNSGATEILTDRLTAIQGEIEVLKKQESMILSVLIKQIKSGQSKGITKTEWTHMLSKAGYTHADQLEWHRNFELDAPKEHETFLRALGMSKKEIIQLKQVL